MALAVLVVVAAVIATWIAASRTESESDPETAPTTASDPGERRDPPFTVEVETLDAALDCDPFTHPDTEPVLMVHGTSVRGHEQWDWNYRPFLRDSGRDVCIVTYPDLGFGDMQTSAEYVARAVQRIHAQSGRSVDMVGHSQGALMPRWAIKYWPTVRAAVDDFVMLAGPQHGVRSATKATAGDEPQSEVLFQLSIGSDFLTALNAGDETPGSIDYTSIYTLFDGIVRPVHPPTAALATTEGDTNVVNIVLQEICPERFVNHITIGTSDAVTMRLVLDALGHNGPTDPERAAIDEATCAMPDEYTTSKLPDHEQIPDAHLTTQEPPLRDYASG